VWNPLRWDTSILSFTLSNLTHTDGIYYAAFLRTIAYVVGATFVCLVIGYPFAYFLARHAGRAKGLFLALFLAPFWFSYMLRMLAWIGLLQDQGYVNRVLQDVGILGAPYPFLSGKSWVLVTGLVYGYVPYMVLPLYAALDRLPVAQLEAARDLGASPARTFFRVTLPQTRQAILAGVIIAGLPMFGDYYTQQLLANTVGTRMIGNFIIDSLDVPIFVSRGSALILVLIALLVVPIVYYLRSTARAGRERAA
jgi:spermidine/putrescine transport system permease protein